MMLKTRIQKKMHMLRALNWYQEQLTNFIHGPIAYSEAQKEVLRIHLKHIQQLQQYNEKSTHWFVPVHIEFENNGIFKVVISEPNNVLYLDE